MLIEEKILRYIIIQGQIDQWTKLFPKSVSDRKPDFECMKFFIPNYLQ